MCTFFYLLVLLLLLFNKQIVVVVVDYKVYIKALMLKAKKQILYVYIPLAMSGFCAF